MWFAQVPGPPPPGPPSPQPPVQQEDHRGDMILKAADDLLWHMKLGDIAEVDKAVFTSLPLRREANPTGQGAGNPFIMYAYTFIPKKLDRAKKSPLIVLIHGGVHSQFHVGICQQLGSYRS
jgi:hypothetical protein